MMREMKNSGIEWIGEIPQDWKIGRIGQLYAERREKVNDTDFQPLSVTMKGIIPQLSTAAKTDAHDDRKLVCIGDFAINSRSDRRGSCGISSYDGSVSLINTILMPRSEINPAYYNWLFRSIMFSDEFYKWGHGIVDDLWTTNWQDMKRITVPMPPLKEQARIALFLEGKCARIDAVIEQTRSSIEEYKKLKQSVITEAVTKGIRPGRKMKDSGVGWIGKIPEDWTVGKAKYYITIGNGSDPQAEGVIPVYGSGAKSFRTCGEFKEGPCVLLGRKGATLHIPHYIDHNYWNVDTAFDVKPSSVHGIDLKFYYYVACCFDYKYYISQTTLPGMTQSNYENMLIPLPKISEQKEITFYLDDKCEEIDYLISKKEQTFTELESYKKSLIFEYVTGKKEVSA